MVFVIRWQSLFPYRLWTCLVALTKSDPSSGPHPSIVSWDWTPDGRSLDIWCPSCDLLWWNAFQEWLILSEDTPPHCSMASIPLLSWNSSHLTRCSLQHGSFEGIALQTDRCRQSPQLTPCFKSSGESPLLRAPNALRLQAMIEEIHLVLIQKLPFHSLMWERAQTLKQTRGFRGRTWLKIPTWKWSVPGLYQLPQRQSN